VKRSGLPIPAQGPHCLRHSYAVHLLRQGTPLKTIGDLLGHRSTESTCVYLRLAVEDLRDVALPLPTEAAGEVRP
jgi:site-specific recombinase XerD